MVVDTISYIVAGIIAVLFIGVVCWYIVWSTKNDTKKELDKTKEELKSLKIVNENLAKFNNSLIDQIQVLKK